jgi:hypothetical protein
MTKLEELKLKEAELQQLLDNLDIIFNTDCDLTGKPLTKIAYEELWKKNKKYENELLQVRLTISNLSNLLHHEEPEKPKQQFQVLITNNSDSGCETDLHPKKRDEPEF